MLCVCLCCACVRVVLCVRVGAEGNDQCESLTTTTSGSRAKTIMSNLLCGEERRLE